jgi:LPS O-antigen subunit length determinant protein (WzzB/FepE family)
VWLYAGKQRAYDTIAKRDAEIVMLEQASKIATAAQIELNNQVTDKQTEIARLTDENETSRRDIADRSRAYAGRMSAQGYCRKTNPTPKGGSPEGGNSSSVDAVVVTRSDFDILTGNTARLVDVKAWADRLIAEGLAVPVE